MDSSYKKIVFISLITIELILRVKACGQTFYQASGIVRSPGYPYEAHGHNLNCNYYIHTFHTEKITLNITHFNLEYDEKCKFDNLTIWDGNDDSSPLIGTFCGNAIMNPIQSTSSNLLIRFRTDGGTAKSGFEIHFNSTATEIPLAITPDGIRYISRVIEAKNKLSEWLKGHRKSTTKTTNRWGLNAHRIASALYLNDEHLFHPEFVSEIEDELRYEITIQVLDKLFNIDNLSTEGIATYMNALLVACLNPRDFHGYDLVAKLRSRVEAESYPNPFVLLTLCNAKDSMNLKDIERLESAFSTRRDRPQWFDSQAIAVLALNCIMRKNEALVNATSILQNSMIQELITNQAKNGAFVSNFKDSALFLQVLIAANSTDKNFNLKAAIKSILSMQKADGSFGSFLNSYYILPVLNSKSLVDIGSAHCQEQKKQKLKPWII